jgi:hypothetical protein
LIRGHLETLSAGTGVDVTADPYGRTVWPSSSDEKQHFEVD